MRRKVVKHGPSTYIISLPTKWVKKYGVKRGDELEVTEEGNKIIIHEGESRESISIKKDVSGLAPRLVDRFLARSYQKGYDNILLIHNDLKILEAIQKKVPELIGYEIMEQDERTCLIQSISHKIEIDFDNSLRRAFLIVKQMLETCVNAYKNSDKDTLKNLYLKDLEVNRTCYFCLRQINKQQYVAQENTQQTHILYYLIEILEDLGDAVKKVSADLARSKKRNSLIRILSKIQSQYDLSYSYFYDATKEKANSAFALYKEIEKNIGEIATEKLEKEEILILINIHDMAHIIYHFTTMRLDYLKEP